MKGEGYLLVDNRASGGGLIESGTAVCAHCNRVVVLNPLRTRARGFCGKCAAYVCDDPTCGLECRPFKRLVDEFKG